MRQSIYEKFEVVTFAPLFLYGAIIAVAVVALQLGVGIVLNLTNASQNIVKKRRNSKYSI